ncbi:MAG TPA: phage portal protein [Rhodospirillaceae bacterium]|nr:phage portal protein [Rhodospirillaceae bacterium]
MGFQSFVNKFVRPKETKTSGAGPVFAYSHVGRPKWTPRRYDCLAEEGYKKNVVAYRCSTLVATAAASVPWVLYGGQDNEIDTHPLLDLLDHPNPTQDGNAFLESLFIDLQISGNAYIEAVSPRDGHDPSELYILRPDRMKVIPGASGLPQGYEYNVGGKLTRWNADPITGCSQILHLKSFHPLNDWYGMAPLEAALLSVDQHNAAGAWNQALLNQGARPSGALVFSPKDGPASLTDEQISRLREEMDEHTVGKNQAGRPLILEGGLDWREMSLSPKDMDWLAGRDAAARDIALAFGVPAQLIGIEGAQTYANMQEARLALYEETVLPLLTKITMAFDHWLAPMFGENLYLDFNRDEISALTMRRDMLWEKLQKVDFLTVNEKRLALGYEPIDGGDHLLSPEESN